MNVKDMKKMVIIFFNLKGFENYQQQPIRLIKDKNKLSINLNFFHMNDKVFKLREILCGKLDMA